jgi:CSLREA domain-containing protein
MLTTRIARRAVAATAASLVALVAGMAPEAHAATINVTPGAVDNVVNGNCSLREAITAANTDAPVDACPAGSGADVINAPGTFTLTAVDNNVPAEFGGPNGLPVITSNITIRGATITRAASAPQFRILQVASGATLTLDSVTVSGGNVSCSSSSCNDGFALGGGILTSGTLNLINSQVQSNTASCSLSSTCAARGGGIYQMAGTVTLTNSSSVNNNLVTCSPPGCDTAAGGGIFADSGVLRISNSDVSGNTASCSIADCKAYAGGILNNATAIIDGSRISGNTASCSGTGCSAVGGGFYNNVGTFTITNSSIVGNAATAAGGTARGGGIFNNRSPQPVSGTLIASNSPQNCAPPGSVPGCVN